MIRRRFVLLAVIQMFALGGCWGGNTYEPETPPTAPVTGTVTLDGKPTPGILVLLFPADNPPDVVDPNVLSLSRGGTDANGKFEITTFKSGDGAPVGEYLVAFYWAGNPKIDPLANADEQPVDPAAAKFNKKYGNASKSILDPVKVEEGKPVDLGVIELKSK